MARRQDGYILMILLILLITSSAGLAYGLITPQSLKSQVLHKNLAQLNQAKQRLIIHAQSSPEIYATDSNGKFLPPQTLPSPGYLPCPDTDNDGASNTPCGQGQDIIIGRLPNTLATRHFRLLEHPANEPFIWYIVDSRYVIQNADYNNPPLKRYTPLNSHIPGEGRITLDNQSNLIALLIMPKDAQQPPSLDPGQLNNLSDINTHYFERRQDLVVALSHSEWRSAIEQRIQLEKATLCQIPPDQAHWFNRCNNTQGAGTEHCDNQLLQNENSTGANWREWLC